MRTSPDSEGVSRARAATLFDFGSLIPGQPRYGRYLFPILLASAGACLVRLAAWLPGENNPGAGAAMMLLTPVLLSGWFRGARAAVVGAVSGFLALWLLLPFPGNGAPALLVYGLLSPLFAFAGTCMHRSILRAQQNEQLLRYTFLNSPVPMLLHNERGEVLALSRAWTDLSGYTPGDIPTVGHWTEKAYGERRDSVRADILRLYELDGPSDEGEYVIRTRAGQQRVWSFTSSPVGRDLTGSRLVLSVACDVTARKHAEDSLRAAHARLQATIDSITDGLLLLDRSWRCTYVSETAARMLRIRPADLIHRNLLDVFDGASTAGFLEQCDVALRSGKPAHFERWFGEPLQAWFEVHAYPSAEGLTVYFRDITVRKKLDDAMGEVQERLELALASTATGTFEMFPGSDRLLWDERSRALYGFTAGEQISVPRAIARIHPDDLPAVQDAIRSAFHPSGSGNYHAEYRVLRQDGTTVWLVSEGRVHYEGEGTARRPIRLVGLNQDVTSRKSVELALRRSEAQLSAVVQNLPVGIGIVENGRVLSLNEEAMRLHGFQFAEEMFSAPGQNSERFRLLRPDGGELPAEEWPTALAERGVFVRDLEVILLREGADPRNILYTVVPAGGSGLHVVVMQDITARKAAEAQLRDSERRYRTLFESIDSGFNVLRIVLDWEGRPADYIFVEANPAFRRHTGLPEPTGKRVSELLPGLDRDWIETYGRVALTGEPVNFVRHVPDLNRTFEVSAFRTGEPSELLVAVIFTDITERRAAELALEKSEEDFRVLANNIPQLCWMADEQGRTLWRNRRLFEYTGLPETALGASPVVEDALLPSRIHPEDLPRVAGGWKQCLETSRPFEAEYRCRRADGVYRWFLAQALPIMGEGGAVLRWFGASTDIHEQKVTEVALRRSNEDLQQFAYVASHDLQEPLRTIVSFSQMLMDRHAAELTGDAREFLGYVGSAGRRMSALVRDLLTYSRCAHDFGDGYTAVDLADVVRNVAEILERLIEEAGAVIETGPLPVVRGDSRRLTQVMQNLMANALKYRHPGRRARVRVSAERQSYEWVISIADNGVGFDQEFAERIFGIFKRLHGSDVPGTGIGLAICKTIVHRHGGRIWAEGCRGEGATFSFTLPIPD